jgi:hypothetical protein
MAWALLDSAFIPGYMEGRAQAFETLRDDLRFGKVGRPLQSRKMVKVGHMVEDFYDYGHMRIA